MLHSTYYHKNSEHSNEDPKTSAVFENLMLLPDNVFWSLILHSCFDSATMPHEPGMLLSYEFWPHWSSKGVNRVTNQNFVEPDLFLRFEQFDVIIEAKFEDCGGQYRQQWTNEIATYYNEYGTENKRLVFIAVGGNLSTISESLTIDNKQIAIYKCNWLSLLISVCKYENEISEITLQDTVFTARRRLLHNIILAFNIHGVYNIEWFNTLLNSKLTINDKSIENINKYFNYE